ncbi:MAG: LytR C-terminal domain-containing protein [Patescibacteria group bacterium]|nr:LytR C-terminal domain-containing protein [Patescibacteria group bacterium]
MIKKPRTIKAASAKAAAAQPKPIEPPKTKTSIYLVLLAIIVLTAIALMVNQKIKSRQQPAQNSATQTAQTDQAKKAMDKSDIQSLIARVGSLIMVNANEEPTIATVQDAEALRKSNPVFYKDAENGDRLLVWSDKAVLYSTRLDKLLAVMPITGQAGVIGPSSTSTQATLNSTTSTIASEKATIEVRNGTRTAGLAKSMASTLKAEGLKVGIVGDLYEKDHAKTVIYMLTDKDMPATLNALETVTRNAEVTKPPVGNFGFKGDFVVIVGSDFVKP